MGFHDVRLPETFSEGSQFGPGFSTKIIELDSGAEHRIGRGPVGGRRKYQIQRGIATIDDLNSLVEFFIAREGALNSFRYKDWLDYATNSTWTTHRPSDPAVAHTDEDLVLVSGLTYQFVKRYVSGSTTVVRTLRKLVSGTVKVGDGTGLRTSGFSLDLANGQVTFSSAPTGQVTGGCEFDVPVRFTEDSDKVLSVSIEALNSGALPEISLIEDVSPTVVSQDFPFGGAKNHGAISADVNMSELDGRFQIFEPSTTGKSVLLPSTTDLPTGGPYFFIYNGGSQTFTLKTSGGTTVVSMTAGLAKTLWLGLNSSGTKTWYAV